MSRNVSCPIGVRDTRKFRGFVFRTNERFKEPFPGADSSRSNTPSGHAFAHARSFLFGSRVYIHAASTRCRNEHGHLLKENSYSKGRPRATPFTAVFHDEIFNETFAETAASHRLEISPPRAFRIHRKYPGKRLFILDFAARYRTFRLKRLRNRRLVIPNEAERQINQRDFIFSSYIYEIISRVVISFRYFYPSSAKSNLIPSFCQDIRVNCTTTVPSLYRLNQ